MNEVTLNKIRALIASADGLIISAGAGMGVDSGLPDFRGNEGMWEHYPALGKLRIGFSSIANPQACLLYTSPSPRDRTRSRMPSSA